MHQHADMAEKGEGDDGGMARSRRAHEQSRSVSLHLTRQRAADELGEEAVLADNDANSSQAGLSPYSVREDDPYRHLVFAIAGNGQGCSKSGRFRTQSGRMNKRGTCMSDGSSVDGAPRQNTIQDAADVKTGDGMKRVDASSGGKKTEVSDGVTGLVASYGRVITKSQRLRTSSSDSPSTGDLRRRAELDGLIKLKECIKTNDVPTDRFRTGDVLELSSRLQCGVDVGVRPMRSREPDASSQSKSYNRLENVSGGNVLETSAASTRQPQDAVRNEEDGQNKEASHEQAIGGFADPVITGSDSSQTYPTARTASVSGKVPNDLEGGSDEGPMMQGDRKTFTAPYWQNPAVVTLDGDNQLLEITSNDGQGPQLKQASGDEPPRLEKSEMPMRQPVRSFSSRMKEHKRAVAFRRALNQERNQEGVRERLEKGLRYFEGKKPAAKEMMDRLRAAWLQVQLIDEKQKRLGEVGVEERLNRLEDARLSLPFQIMEPAQYPLNKIPIDQMDRDLRKLQQAYGRWINDLESSINFMSRRVDDVRKLIKEYPSETDRSMAEQHLGKFEEALENVLSFGKAVEHKFRARGTSKNIFSVSKPNAQVEAPVLKKENTQDSTSARKGATGGESESRPIGPQIEHDGTTVGKQSEPTPLARYRAMVKITLQAFANRFGNVLSFGKVVERGSKMGESSSITSPLFSNPQVEAPIQEMKNTPDSASVRRHQIGGESNREPVGRKIEYEASEVISGEYASINEDQLGWL